MVLLAVIDLGPLFEQIVWPVLGIIATGLATWLVQKLAKNADAATQERFRDLAKGILQAGLQRAQASFASSNLEHVDVQNQILARALEYAVANGSTGMKNVGIDLTTDDGRKEATEKLQSMLAPSVMLAVASPGKVSVAAATTALNPVVAAAASAASETTVPHPVSGAPVPVGPVAQLTAGATPPKEST